MSVQRTRSPVPFVKFTARFYRHPKREPTLLSLAADGLLVRATSYARDNDTDGFVPDWWIDQQVESRHRKRLREELVKPRPPHARPLFEEADGGLLIHDFLDVNLSAAEIAGERRRERDRKREQRNGRRQERLKVDTSVPPDVPRDTLASGSRSEANDERDADSRAPADAADWTIDDWRDWIDETLPGLTRTLQEWAAVKAQSLFDSGYDVTAALVRAQLAAQWGEDAAGQEAAA